MERKERLRHAAPLHWTVGLPAVYALLGGAVSFLGWLLDVPTLTDWDDDGIAIQPNATVAATLAGGALLMLDAGRSSASRALAVVVGAIGATALLQWLSGVSFGTLNTLLMFGHEWGRVGVVHPGLMGPPGSLCWTILGGAIVLATLPPGSSARRGAPVLALAALAISLLSIVGYVYRVERLHTLPTATVIALQTATFIAAVALATLAAVRESPPARWLLHDGPAGDVARKTLPLLVAVPLALGTLVLAGEAAGFYGMRFAVAILVFGLIALLLVLFATNLNALIRHEEQMRDADRRKNDFLATLAHELRNPLAPIRNGVHILRARPGDAEVVARTSATIGRQVDQMVRLVDDLLDVSRITQDRIELRREPVDVASVVDAAVEAVDALRERLGHRIEVDVPAGVIVDADRARLTQVVSNLLHNALKFMAPGGRVLVAVTSADGSVRIRVRDEGVGLAADQLARIFEPFVQIDESLEKSQGGLGIGLWLVRRLAALHGGHVVATSEGLGKGTEFILTLPLRAAP